MIAIFLTIIQTILFAAHYFVYKTFSRAFDISAPTHIWWTRIIFILLSISFLAASTITYKYYGSVGRTFYTMAALWLGTMYWLFFASLFSWIIWGIGRLAFQGRNLNSLVVLLFLAALVTSAYGFWNSYQTKVREVKVTIKNLPQQWKGRRAVLVADTHMGSVRNTNFGKKVAKLIEAQHPDIVLIPGDFYDGPPTDYAATAKPFGEIKSTFGTYFAPGNHEEFGDSKPLLSALASSGVHVLNDRFVVVDGLQIIGVGYSTTTNAVKQKKVLDSLTLDKSTASILIKHAPTEIPLAEAAGINFQVSGHTHLGQVYPLKYITKMVYGQFYYGLSKFNDMSVLTTSGVGTWGPPQRVGTNSEIVVITFE